MRAVVTGANGFIGRQLTRQLLTMNTESLVLVDGQFDERWPSADPRITLVQGQLQSAELRQRALAGGCDHLFHLAAVPGGAAEANPVLSKAVNLDATLALIEEVAGISARPRVVFASTIAVLGAPLPELVDDACPIIPAMTYGAHKAMVELALADMTRRGLIDAVSVRLPGIVARPASPSGLKSAFLSDVFHALNANRAFVCPVSGDATLWLMSVQRCAVNLIHAGQLDSALLPLGRAVTLPALRCTMAELITAIAEATHSASDLVSYQVDQNLEINFGRQPRLVTPAADRAGFCHDGSLQVLVNYALEAARN